MTPLFAVSGRDVLFVHWPVAPDELRRRLPDGFAPETFDGSAWVSALAIGHVAARPEPTTLPIPGAGWGGGPQLTFRTYVNVGDGSGVYFLSLDSDDRLAAAVGRRAFGLPVHRAWMRATERGDGVVFRMRRRDRTGPTAVFQARYRPQGGGGFQAAPGSFEAFCVERFRYYLPASEDRRTGPFRAGYASGDGIRVGTIDRHPWSLRPVEAAIRRNTLFGAADAPDPTGDPLFQYSPGFEMGVGPLEPRRGDPEQGDRVEGRRERRDVFD
jgi:hypothetical protein